MAWDLTVILFYFWHPELIYTFCCRSFWGDDRLTAFFSSVTESTIALTSPVHRTRPDARLSHSREGGQGPCLGPLSISVGALKLKNIKKKNIKKEDSDRPTNRRMDGRTKRGDESRSTRPEISGGVTIWYEYNRLATASYFSQSRLERHLHVTPYLSGPLIDFNVYASSIFT